jgi:hypothetical protein
MKFFKKIVKPIDRFFFNKFFQDIISLRIFKNFHLTASEVSNIQRWIFFFQHIKNNNVEGDIVECGVGNGLSLSIIIYLKNHYNLFDTKIFACDSFKGFPEPKKIDFFDKKHKAGDWSHTNLNYVKENIIKFGITEKQVNDVIFVTGYFENTLQNLNTKKISLLHLDCDLYQSYKISFEKLSNKVSENGIIILDEYFKNNKLNRFPGAVAATDEYVLENNLKVYFINDKGYILKKNFFKK